MPNYTKVDKGYLLYKFNNSRELGLFNLDTLN